MAEDNEKPQQRVHLAEFYIGKYPVTNAQYAAYVEAGGEAPDYWQGRQIPSGRAEHPVVGVSWGEARDFCAWLSQATGRAFRLPSEAEWEKAARGTDGRIYPWGDQAPDAERCNFKENLEDTTPVGRYPAGASPFGVLDMSGNAWEWCQTKWRDSYRQPADDDPAGDAARVLRGGTFLDYARLVRCAFRLRYGPDFRYGNYGFRVVASPSIHDREASLWDSGL